MDRQTVTVEVRATTVLKIIAILLVTAAVTAILAQVHTVIVWLGIALFIAIALAPAVRYVQQWMPHTLAVITVWTGLILLIVAFLAVLIIPIATQFGDLEKAAPSYIAKLKHNRTINDLNERYDIVGKAQKQAARAPSVAFGLAGRVVSGVTATITVLFLTLFLMFELPNLASAFLALLKPEIADRCRRLAVQAQRTVGGYLIGNIIISIIAGSVVGVSLKLLGVPYALALGVLMALFDLIPLVGATIGAAGACLIAFAAAGTTAGIIMIVVNVVYQQIENHVLQPIVYRRTVQLSSFLVLVAVLLGGTLLGILGALVAIPIAGTIQVIVRDLLQDWVGLRASDPQPLAGGGANGPSPS